MTRMSRLLRVTEGTISGTHLHNPRPRPLGAPPLQQHVSCQNKPLGEGTAEAEASTEETPATNPKHTIGAPPGPDRGSVHPPQPGQRSGATRCPLPEPGWWEPLVAPPLARAQREVNRGQAATTPAPPGPEARGRPNTRRGHSVPSPRSHAGRRFEVKQGIWGGGGEARSRALPPLAAGPRTQLRDEVGEADGQLLW